MENIDLCSTVNISHKRNIRAPLSQRLNTRAKRLLRRYEIGNRDISELSGVALATANRALSLEFARVNYGDVVRVRRAAEQLLNSCGWASDGHLWADYDDQLMIDG